MPSKLSDYHRKRRAEATNEPFGGEGGDAGASSAEESSSTLSGAYVVHLHDATRRHYDLRLEVGGVLASFAVPRGPSLNPDDKHLAVKTEDHPLEYLEFEDVIPESLYGAGPMIAWDRGKVTYLEGPAEREIESGKLHFELRGLKLRGRWALVKLQKSDQKNLKGNEWLLFKKQDDHASKEKSLVEELPRSIYSGLTVEELERRDAIGKDLLSRARKIGAPVLGSNVELLAPSRSLLAPVAPSFERARATSGREFVYDADLDGIRVLAAREGDVVTIQRDGEGATPHAVETFYPEVVRALRTLPVSRVALDGQLVAFAESGHPSLSLLARRAVQLAKGDGTQATVETPVVFLATDLLVLGERDLRSVPLDKRRSLLEALLPAQGVLRAPPPVEGPLETILSFCTTHGIPGVVAKKKGEPYGGDWAYVASDAPRRSQATVVHATSKVAASPHRVTVSNRSKLFWPAEGYTKGDLCDYYEAIADVILPYVAERPVILVRYPDGIEGKNFFQWNVPPGMPAWVRTLALRDDEGRPRRGFLLDDRATLLYVANLAAIPLHVLAARVPNLDVADFFTIDFDVKQSSLENAVTLARTLREILDEIGLPGFPKTSGQTGLHVLVPLGPGQTFETARALADLLGRLLVERWPDLATMERIVSKRGAKVYVDTGQTGTTRAIVAPYSVRAVAGATVSTPLAWDELDADLDPRRFTIETVPERTRSKVGDPMKGMLAARPDIARAVSRLSKLVGPRR